MDAYDRCIVRGFPALMMPLQYNDGLRVFQSPGFLAIQLEMFGPRIIPLGEGEEGGEGRGEGDTWPDAVRQWNGTSRGHWEGETLVIETAHIVSGDSATSDLAGKAGAPLPGRTLATVPMSPAAQTLERLTMTGPDTIAYELTYWDPAVFTAPWTVAIEWIRDDSYQFFEFACHEGNGVRALMEDTRRRERESGR